MSDQEERAKGFKVTDRRSFTREGERIARTEEEPPAVDNSVLPSEPSAPPREKAPPRAGTPGQLEAGFLDLLSLLATQASLALGAPHPATGEAREDLEMARVMISMIEVLREKTTGNLTRDEQGALEEILYQLRTDFMTKAKVAKS